MATAKELPSGNYKVKVFDYRGTIEDFQRYYTDMLIKHFENV